MVVTWGCVDGVDWAKNAERDDGGIRQDMGEVFSTKVCIMTRRACENALTISQFGPVERLQVNESNAEGVVYIHFKSVLSALNVGLGSHTCSTSTNISFRPSTVLTKDFNTEAGTSAHATTTNASSMLAFTTIDGISTMYQLDLYTSQACLEATGGSDCVTRAAPEELHLRKCNACATTFVVKSPIHRSFASFGQPTRLELSTTFIQMLSEKSRLCLIATRTDKQLLATTTKQHFIVESKTTGTEAGSASSTSLSRS